MVMPFSRSRSLESMTRSSTSWFSRNAPDCHSMASTSVVLPWSTCATMATLRRSARRAEPSAGVALDMRKVSISSAGKNRDTRGRAQVYALVPDSEGNGQVTAFSEALNGGWPAGDLHHSDWTSHHNVDLG